MTILEKSLCLSYILSKMLHTNLETALCELKELKHEDSGKMEFNIAKLMNANKKAFSVVERNLADGEELKQLQADVELLISDIWD